MAQTLPPPATFAGTIGATDTAGKAGTAGVGAAVGTGVVTALEATTLAAGGAVLVIAVPVFEEVLLEAVAFVPAFEFCSRFLLLPLYPAPLPALLAFAPRLAPPLPAPRPA